MTGDKELTTVLINEAKMQFTYNAGGIFTAGVDCTSFGTFSALAHESGDAIKLASGLLACKKGAPATPLAPPYVVTLRGNGERVVLLYFDAKNLTEAPGACAAKHGPGVLPYVKLLRLPLRDGKKYRTDADIITLHIDDIATIEVRAMPRCVPADACLHAST